MIWRCRDRRFELDQRTLVMGVVNLTPDSFSDGGRFPDPLSALAHARALMTEGADLLDLGAESTRPGAEPVPAAEQWRRLEPVLRPLAAEGTACLSVDTASAEVAARALEAGAHVINDVRALADPDMAAAVARSGAGLVLMHMLETPATMQHDPHYDDAAREIAAFLAERCRHAEAAGVASEAIAVDPGIGFGKTLRHNLELLARLPEIAALGRPVLVGVSRKRFLGALLDLPVDERLEGGLAAHALAAFLGASIVRTHDVRVTVRAVKVARAIAGARRA
jgi:dihydropteroate synthase